LQTDEKITGYIFCFNDPLHRYYPECCGSLLRWFSRSEKVSLSGELASCGMAQQEPLKPGINNPPVCSNTLSAYILNGNNFVSSSLISVDFVKKLITAIESPSAQAPACMPEFKAKALCNRPPGMGNPGEVKLEYICVYRI
jgi:hypothetical protein